MFVIIESLDGQCGHGEYGVVGSPSSRERKEVELFLYEMTNFSFYSLEFVA